MTSQAKARDIGQRMYTRHGCQRRAWTVQLGGVGNHLCIARIIQRIFLQRCRQHAHAKWFSQYQAVAHTRIGIALDPRRVHQAHDHQTVNGLDRINGVATRNRDACIAAHALTTLQNLANGLQAQHIDGHAHQRQRHDGGTAHGIHV